VTRRKHSSFQSAEIQKSNALSGLVEGMSVLLVYIVYAEDYILHAILYYQSSFCKDTFLKQSAAIHPKHRQPKAKSSCLHGKIPNV